MKSISPETLIPMDLFTDFPLEIDLAYAHDKAPNIFGAVYRKDARLWLHEDLAKIVLLATSLLFKREMLHVRLYDGLRTMEAQERMRQSEIVQANPRWLEEPGRLLSPPGAGAHPRGMAIDLTLQAPSGQLLDMGTVFDHLSEDPSPENNPAHRDHPNLNNEAAKNRKLLTDAMCEAAEKLDIPLFPLPQEWWDFRLHNEVYEQYAPLSDQDLPNQMRMVSQSDAEDLPPEHFEKIKQSLSEEIQALH